MHEKRAAQIVTERVAGTQRRGKKAQNKYTKVERHALLSTQRRNLGQQ